LKTIKQTLSKETLLTYPEFTEPFEIHTDASHSQQGVANVTLQNPGIQQQNMNYLQLMTLSKNSGIFYLAMASKLSTNHKNVTKPNFSTKRVMCWS
jgi:hypothetical protein